MTITERFNQLYDSFNEIISLLSNIEAFIGTTSETSTNTINGKILYLEQLINNTRQVIEDRLIINNDTFTLAYTPKTNSNIWVRIVDNINNEICDIGELEQEDLTIDYNNKTVTLNTTEFDGKYAKVIYITHEV